MTVNSVWHGFSGLSTLLHGVISLPDATSCDNAKQQSESIFQVKLPRKELFKRIWTSQARISLHIRTGRIKTPFPFPWDNHTLSDRTLRSKWVSDFVACEQQRRRPTCASVQSD